MAEARAVEATGKTVRYLNIGDPIPFGFHTPPALVDVVAKAMHDGRNNYVPSTGIQPALHSWATASRAGWMPVDGT